LDKPPRDRHNVRQLAFHFVAMSLVLATSGLQLGNGNWATLGYFLQAVGVGT